MTRQTREDLPDARPLPTEDADTLPESERDPDTRPRAKLLDLSLTQLLGGSLAAATAAALGSRLGVFGTIAGAAVLSIVSATAANLYTNSMARAKDAVVLVRSRHGAVAALQQVRWRRPDQVMTRRVLAMTGAVFAVAAAFLAGLQLTTGAQVTGTNLGRLPSAGVLVDGSAADPGGTNGSSAAEDEHRVSPGDVTTVPTAPSRPTGTPTTGTPTTGTPDPNVTVPGGAAQTTGPAGVDDTIPRPASTPDATPSGTPTGGTSATSPPAGSGG